METSNSAGMLTLDGNSCTNYCIDNVALLETVSEDQEACAFKLRTQGISNQNLIRITPNRYLFYPGLKESSVDHLNDYYFQDSFDHSSSESQLHENSFKGFEGTSHRSSRSPTPLGHTNVDNRLYLQQDNLAPHIPKMHTQHPTPKFNLLKAFVPSLAFVVVFVVILTVVMLETDCELFGSLRNIPEMISLRYQYYEPFKQFLRNKISSIF